MVSKTKKSEIRINTLEEHIWKGIQDGINATDNKATIPELLDVLNRYSYTFNKRNLEFNRTGVDVANDNLSKD